MRLLGLEQGFAVQRRVHVTRGDGVDADAVGRPFGCEGFCQLGGGGFGGAVWVVVFLGFGFGWVRKKGRGVGGFGV